MEKVKCRKAQGRDYNRQRDYPIQPPALEYNTANILEVSYDIRMLFLFLLFMLCLDVIHLWVNDVKYSI